MPRRRYDFASMTVGKTLAIMPPNGGCTVCAKARLGAAAGQYRRMHAPRFRFALRQSGIVVYLTRLPDREND